MTWKCYSRSSYILRNNRFIFSFRWDLLADTIHFKFGWSILVFLLCWVPYISIIHTLTWINFIAKEVVVIIQKLVKNVQKNSSHHTLKWSFNAFTVHADFFFATPSLWRFVDISSLISSLFFFFLLYFFLSFVNQTFSKKFCSFHRNFYSRYSIMYYNIAMTFCHLKIKNNTKKSPASPLKKKEKQKTTTTTYKLSPFLN